MGNSRGLRLWKSLTRTKGILSEERTSSFTVDSYQGTQGIYMCDPFLDRDDLSAIWSSVDTQARTSKCMLGLGKSMIHIRNQSNNLCKLRLYEIWTTRNPQDAKLNFPQGAWYDHCTDQSFPQITVQDGLLNGAHKVDETPFAARDFARYYRVHRVHTVHLEPGQQHNHTVRHKMFRVMSKEAWEDTPALMVSMGGITRHFMLVWYGGLTHDTLVAPAWDVTSGVKVQGGATAAVTVSSIRLDVAVRHSYNWVVDASAVGRVFKSGDYKRGIGDEDFMGENGDADLSPTGA